MTFSDRNNRPDNATTRKSYYPMVIAGALAIALILGFFMYNRTPVPNTA